MENIAEINPGELAAAIALTVLVLFIVVPGLLVAIGKGCFGKKHREEKKDDQSQFGR